MKRWRIEVEIAGAEARRILIVEADTADDATKIAKNEGDPRVVAKCDVVDCCQFLCWEDAEITETV